MKWVSTIAVTAYKEFAKFYNVMSGKKNIFNAIF